VAIQGGEWSLCRRVGWGGGRRVATARCLAMSVL